MPEMRMNSFKSGAMNCGPLSEMIRGLASGYRSSISEDLSVGIGLSENLECHQDLVRDGGSW